MTFETLSLADLGWTSFFASQRDANDDLTPVRVMAVHRNGLHVAGADIDRTVPPYVDDPDDELSAATVGDWLLLDASNGRPRRLLNRKSLFKRRAAGTVPRPQLIAANVDTLFIVSSCNQDFNVARLERYLAVAREAEATPVVVLTKADLAATPTAFAEDARRLAAGLLVEVLDARDPEAVDVLRPWCGRGQTVALLGSSGVGKSTLVSTLTGDAGIETQTIREHDDKGRHTTTGRTVHRLPAGGWLLDTPGMRELQISDVKAGLADLFSDIVETASRCRFSDCHHDQEPGCAVKAAIETGELEVARFTRWRKLAAEDARNTETISQRRARDRAFGKLARRLMAEKKERRGG